MWACLAIHRRGLEARSLRRSCRTGKRRAGIARRAASLVSLDGTLRLWNEESMALKVLKGHQGTVKAAFALGDRRLLSWSGDHTLHLWNHQSRADGGT
jgi:WD40 repeat protein